MYRSHLVVTAAALGLLLAFAGCTQEVERPDTPTPTIPIATPTPTLTPTSTPAFTPTPTPPPASTPVPRLFLDVQGPADGTTVRSNAAVVHGVTSRETSVSIGGQVAFVDRDGRFQLEVTLSPGENIIEVTAIDATGSQLSETITITFQAISPQPFFLLIAEPEDQSVVSSSTISLSGQTAPEAVVSVNGVGIEVGEQGGFSTTVALEQGPNIIDVVATNPDGRVLSAVIAVIFRP